MLLIFTKILSPSYNISFLAFKYIGIKISKSKKEELCGGCHVT
jgi:hypothetical protein